MYDDSWSIFGFLFALPFYIGVPVLLIHFGVDYFLAAGDRVIGISCIILGILIALWGVYALSSFWRSLTKNKLKRHSK